MKFGYEMASIYGDYLWIKTDHGVRVEISFYGQKIEEMYIEEHQIWTVSDGIFVLIGGEYVSLKTIWEEAERQYPAIIAEVEQEQADEEAHEREMSSLEKTGRI